MDIPFGAGWGLVKWWHSRFVKIELDFEVTGSDERGLEIKISAVNKGNRAVWLEDGRVWFIYQDDNAPKWIQGPPLSELRPHGGQYVWPWIKILYGYRLQGLYVVDRKTGKRYFASKQVICHLNIELEEAERNIGAD